MTDQETLLEEFNRSREKGLLEFHNSPDTTYFIISKKWLDQWIATLKEGQDYVGQPQINNELILHKNNTIFKYDPITSHMWNKILLPNLQEGVDYEILDKETWKIIDSRYNAIKIERDTQIVNGKKIVNVDLVQLNVIAIFPSSISKLKGGKGGSLIKGDQYVSRSYPLQSFLGLLENTLTTVNGFHFLRQNAARLYKCKSGMTHSEIEQHITTEMKDLTFYDDPQFEFKDCDYLDPLKYQLIQDCDIEPGQIILADFKESQKNWCIKNPYFPMEAKCESCYNYKILAYPCECKKVSYCSEECKKRDENYHTPRCEKTDSDEETMNKLVRTETSLDGKCGMKNLGNTCFMNSGIQCLSNTLPIREFLLSNLYKNDINVDNTLGTKGELVTKFANLLKRMWLGDKGSFAPFSLKRAIGKFQPQFQGFQQHDSQELITYLLDGLHEDLNRIKVKPYVERKDYDQRPDFDVAKESWEQFKQRNDSLIVDNLYGLYKSTIKCPTCAKISITFDPFLMVNVGIPQNSVKKFQIQFIDPTMLWDCQTIDHSYDKASDLSLGDVLQNPIVKEKIQNLNADQLIYLCSSTYQHDETDQNEKLNSLKKKLKYKKLYIRKALQSELEIPKDDRVSIMIHEAYKQYASYQWKRDITPSLNFIFNKQTSTTYDIHKLIYELHIGIFKYFENMPQLGDDFDEFYSEKIKDKLYSLEFKSNQNWQVDCAFCQQKQCNDCPVTFSKDDKIESFLAKEPKLELEVFVVWKRGLKDEQQIEELYNDWIKTHTKTENQPETEILAITNNNNQSKSDIPSMTLGECLRFSEKPEQLDEENTWYCANCKEHVRAFKTMEIYKVPKILIFHLKRFKNSNKFFKSKLETQIEFPVEGFDVREYIINHHIPDEFETEDPLNQKKNEPLLYDLYAISNHFGGLGGGHYTAYAKNCYDKQWYNYDDSCVSSIKEEEVAKTIITPAAYVLFYCRRD